MPNSDAVAKLRAELVKTQRELNLQASRLPDEPVTRSDHFRSYAGIVSRLIDVLDVVAADEE